ncbi:hypothetical protein Rumeso_04608 [Rubellimicrobium mesophilum DSM 19309]|uniref:Uncharacterized protein n=1 Tax=Rubellimicrobium mesophilum DSM 19309 TaxID=442562 RepID=A0A017HHN4_9RHOB|nr:hypothetical protein [Rubellimicrobium mesophilum]EYD73835.1 hypothetical protein Rumeso_04608 [Rubellimicrobium mesophilum DSM 19309]
MDSLLSEKLFTLRKAKSALSGEMEWRAQTDMLDPHGLWRLGELARSFQQQARLLLVTMAREDASESSQQEAEELIDLFGCILNQAEAMLASMRKAS